MTLGSLTWWPSHTNGEEVNFTPIGYFLVGKIDKKWTLLRVYSAPKTPSCSSQIAASFESGPKNDRSNKKKPYFDPPYHIVSLDNQIKNLRFRPKFKTIHKVHMAPCKPKKQYGRKNNLRHF